MLRILKNDGFASYVEIIITAVIFVLASVGIYTAASIFQPKGVESSKRLQAAYAGRKLIDQMRAAVDANSWNNPAGLLFPTISPQTVTIDGFNVTYNIVENATTGLRMIEMSIEIPD